MSSFRFTLRQNALWAAAAVVVLAFGVWRACSLMWVCDDAFISFRYARNLAAGNGLTYNVGEKVEGYTNFLWTILLSGAIRAGADPVPFSEIAGIACYAVLLLLAILFSRRIYESLPEKGSCLPLCALALCANSHVACYATSGLETSLFTTLAFAGFLLLAGVERGPATVASGGLLALATMTRPDGAIFIFFACVYLAARCRWKSLAFFATPAFLLLAPYGLWRLSYYGDWFPNTFYAKSASLPKYEQGWVYLSTYLSCYRIGVITILVAGAGLSGLAVRRRAGMTTGAGFLPGEFLKRVLPLSLLFAAGYASYVVRVGGDFMFARFLIPATPFLYAALECVLASAPRGAIRSVVAGAVVLATLINADPFRSDPTTMISGIADERSFYPAERMEQARRTGETLQRFFQGTATKVVYYGAQAVLAYYSEVPVAIEGETGLTDRYIAHLPFAGKGRIGHEKRCPYSYLMKRHVNFILRHPAALDLGYPMRDYQKLFFDEASWKAGPDFWGARIISYDRGLMDEFKRRGAHFVDFPSFLDQYLQDMPRLDRDKAERDYREFQLYYFMHNNDPERRDAFERVLRNP